MTKVVFARSKWSQLGKLFSAGVATAVPRAEGTGFQEEDRLLRRRRAKLTRQQEAEREEGELGLRRRDCPFLRPGQELPF